MSEADLKNMLALVVLITLMLCIGISLSLKEPSHRSYSTQERAEVVIRVCFWAICKEGE